MNVVCLNHRNYLGLGNLYVSRLRSMVKRHLTIPHSFLEITEYETPKDVSGWWAKLALLNMFDGEVLYFDLDVIISGRIDHLVEIGRSDRSKLWARNDFSYPVSLESKVVGDGFAGPLMEDGREATINSSVMYWCGRRCIARREGVHGDQGCITAALWPDGIRLFPEIEVKSYKYDYLRGNGFGPVTVLHGSPKNHEIADGDPLKAHWR